MPRSRFLLLAGCTVLAASLSAQRSECWQRRCARETTLRPDSLLPGVTNAWSNIVGASHWAREHHLPAFDAFPVADTQHLPAHRPDLRSDSLAHRYRTAVRRAARRGADFAGHFTVVTVGCGSPCIRLMILDQRSGRVYSTPDQLVRPPMYRKDSRLLIEDPTGFMTDTLGHPGFPFVRYWEWTGTRLRLLTTLQADTIPLRILSE